MRIRGYLMATVALFLFSGCAMRTYDILQDRPDQDLTSGNRGTLKGDVPRDDLKDRKTTRQIKVLELEVLPSKTAAQPKVAAGAAVVQNQAVDSDAAASVGAVSAAPVVPVFAEYKVKENDTLQKIARNYYGSINQWIRIYDANRDILKSPDSIYPGQTLKIPVAEKTK